MSDGRVLRVAEFGEEAFKCRSEGSQEGVKNVFLDIDSVSLLMISALTAIETATSFECTYLATLVQVCPELKATLTADSEAAFSTLPSSNRIIGALPPSSNVQAFMLLFAAIHLTAWPVSALPVNAILRISMWLARDSPDSRPPERICTIPGGKRPVS